MKWSCRCGAFAAEVETGRGLRVVCYCPSCRRFAEDCGASDKLDEFGGSDLFQVAPEEMRIERGAEVLTHRRMTAKGPLRWVTSCCGTPLANTLDTPALPFITLQSAWFEDPAALGPVRVRGFRHYALGRVPDDSRGQAYLFTNFARRAIQSRLTGGWKRNPLFDADGSPTGRAADPMGA